MGVEEKEKQTRRCDAQNARMCARCQTHYRASSCVAETRQERRAEPQSQQTRHDEEVRVRPRHLETGMVHHLDRSRSKLHETHPRYYPHRPDVAPLPVADGVHGFSQLRERVDERHDLVALQRADAW